MNTLLVIWIIYLVVCVLVQCDDVLKRSGSK
jgi:hypothetical protein